MNETTHFFISKETRDALLGYLYTRPYAEVARGVEMLRDLASVPSVPPPEPPIPLKPTEQE